MRTTTTSYSIGPRTSYFFHVFNLSYKSRSPGQAKPEPSRGWWLWPGLGFQKAKAIPGQAKAPAFRPSRAGTTLVPTIRYSPYYLSIDSNRVADLLACR